MHKFSVFINNRPEYRRTLKVLKKNSKISPTIEKWGARSIFFNCESEKDATVLAGLIKASLEKDNIIHSVIV